MNSQDILKLEEELIFDDFDNEDAYQIGQRIVEKVKKDHLKNVRIRIELDGDIIFQYFMNGKKGALWLNRKANTFEKTKHSGYYVYLKNQEDKSYKEYENNDDYVLCGGSFPLIIKNEIKGAFYISGLEHSEDHQLIVDVLKEYIKEK